MRVDLTINDVLNDWVFNGERTWKVKYNGKTYSFISPHKPVIGSYIPCDVVERASQTKDGKPITYRDARPIPEHILKDDVPNFPTPAASMVRATVKGVEPVEKPQLALSGAETPEWAKPGPKPTLAGDLYLMGRYLDVLLNHPKINLANEVNWLGGFSSVIATGLRDYHDGKLEVNVDLIPDDIRAAYLEAANGEWPGDEKKLKP